MADSPDSDGVPGDPALVVLKWLVIGLTATMLVGMIILIWLFATRLPKPVAPLPAALSLPDGETVQAITQGRGFVAVVTSGGEILIFDATGQTLRRRIDLD